VGTIVKTAMSETDITIGVSHALEDFDCKGYIYGRLTVIGSVSSALV